MTITKSLVYPKLTSLKNLLLNVEDFYDLQILLKVGARELESHINKPIYNSFQIPKKKGGFRKILSPNDDLLQIQKQLNLYFQAIYLLVKPTNVHGFIAKPKGYEINHSIMSNAFVHTNKKHVLNIDLKDFFPSISASRVRKVLVNHIGLNDNQIADAIALLCTYQKSLPVGAPTSPVLANFTCLDLDKELLSYCSLYDITYTRYADDLTFSSQDYFNSETIKFIRSIIDKHHFIINEKKFRLLSSQSKQTVTGITVNEKLNVSRVYIRNIRAILHNIKIAGIEAATKKHYKVVFADSLLQKKLVSKLNGQIDFVGQVRGKEDVIYNKLKSSYLSISR